MRVLHTLTITAAAVALLAFSGPKAAFSQAMDMSKMEHTQGHGQMMEMGHMDKMDDMMGMCIEHGDKMGLSDDQMAKMKPMHREMQKKQVRFRADLKIAEIELMEIMEVKDFDLEKAALADKKIEGLKTAYHLEMLKGMREMRTMLTDAQFKSMQKMMPMKMEMKKPGKRNMKKHHEQHEEKVK